MMVWLRVGPMRWSNSFLSSSSLSFVLSLMQVCFAPPFSHFTAEIEADMKEAYVEWWFIDASFSMRINHIKHWPFKPAFYLCAETCSCSERARGDVVRRYFLRKKEKERGFWIKSAKIVVVTRFRNANKSRSSSWLFSVLFISFCSELGYGCLGLMLIISE